MWERASWHDLDNRIHWLLDINRRDSPGLRVPRPPPAEPISSLTRSSFEPISPAASSPTKSVSSHTISTATAPVTSSKATPA